ncbi:MAG TPA: hypothetical protein DCF68_12170, partial [Cyanothece sp. UBA12306]|nr:hypothetical protein [Cyanothece sp. UBA12306]
SKLGVVQTKSPPMRLHIKIILAICEQLFSKIILTFEGLFAIRSITDNCLFMRKITIMISRFYLKKRRKKLRII